jgi:hypothetical protein
VVLWEIDKNAIETSGRRVTMKNLLITLFLLFLSIPAIALAGGNEKKQSFYKYPHSNVLPAGSIWNPLVTTKDGKKVSETYYKYPDSQTLPAGSIWNPYVTVKERSKGQKKGR